MKTTLIAIALLMATFLSGCNTVKGVGQDIQKAGEAVENAVKKK